ncbi:MAG: DUF1015 domain-containing protein [Bacteroidota bacterium]
MTKIRAFRAVRPTRDKAHLVASRAVATYKPAILAAKLESNPYTFIHIIHPEYFEDDDNRTAPNTPERFNKVKNKFEAFRKDGVFIQDEEEQLYVYRQTKGDAAFLGVIGGASAAEYQNDQIKKHEATLTSREEMFTNYLDIVGFNAEPVLLSHRKSEKVDELLHQISQKRPEYEFTTTDSTSHELWLTTPEETKALQDAYEEIEAVYIADGHHRSASSVRLMDLHRERGDYAPEKNYNSFLSFFIDEERLQILPFNRICKSLNGLSPSEFIEKCKGVFDIEAINKQESINDLHVFHVYLNQQWYRFRLKDEYRDFGDAVDAIDAEILTRHILDPILGIKDLKIDDSISFVSGDKGKSAIEQAVDNNVYTIGFELYPVTVDQLTAVADEHKIMPPKSTWVEPKLRSGLTIYKIDE